jgi:hypothetical protein
MAQIQSPETYADGQQVTAARLNNQTNGAVLLPGAVTDQTAISGGVAAADAVIVHDASASAIRKATVTELLGGGVPVVASSVTGVAGSDLAIIPAAGQKVDVGGAFEANSINSTGSVTIGGDVSITGTLSVTGSTSMPGGVSGNVSVSGLISASTAPTVGDHLTNKSYVDGAVSKTANGYVTLPNGLILQWGTTANVAPDNSVVVTFPIAFPTACVNVQASVKTGTGAGIDVWAIGVTFTSTTTTIGVGANGGSVGAVPLCWFAIGY